MKSSNQVQITFIKGFSYYYVTLILDQSLVECNVTTLKPGSVVYLTAFVNMDEMYIRKLEDYNDEFHNLLDKVNEFCLSGKYK